MVAVMQIGAIVAPRRSAFYARPGSLEAGVDDVVRRAIGPLDVDLGASISEWKG